MPSGNHPAPLGVVVYLTDQPPLLQGTSELEPSEEEIRNEVANLKNNPTKELLQSMSISLRSRPIRWVSKFTEQQGITVLLDYLINMDDKAKEDGHEELLIKCLKALMNNSV